ncbi:MAG: MFS transporter [Candidatus Izemoplasmatales bacterium]|jgi:MFS family permease|nr:MFS transporter [Candidatus Izemoplasmatales bacterium]MDD3865426.1 MFS transporter [Candidatus Izemoplasmatales bacterium]
MDKSLKKRAFIFLLFLGFISLLSDFTHEGARSIYGNYLGLIGVSAFLVAFISGLGEFLGQGLRIVTGYIADKTKKYWFMMILGYAVNLLVIPLLGLIDGSLWQVALILIVLERVGKAIRAPAKSALTSFTAPHLGAGKAFAIQEALDQIGAFLGPLLVFIILGTSDADPLSKYQLSFGVLGIFAIMTLVLLVIAKTKYPHPDQFEQKTNSTSFKGNAIFIIYMVAICFIALGFIDYPVIALHLENAQAINVIYIPLLYSVAMGVDALSALIFGHLFDKIGVKSLVIAMLIAMLFAPFIFLSNSMVMQIIGVVLWGIGMGAQESILKSVVATIVSKEKRATAYGIFNSVFGLAWFIGSTIVGLLYGWSLLAVVIFSVVMEIIGVLLLVVFHHKQKSLPTMMGQSTPEVTN